MVLTSPLTSRGSVSVSILRHRSVLSAEAKSGLCQAAQHSPGREMTLGSGSETSIPPWRWGAGGERSLGNPQFLPADPGTLLHTLHELTHIFTELLLGLPGNRALELSPAPCFLLFIISLSPPALSLSSLCPADSFSRTITETNFLYTEQQNDDGIHNL